jgi:hypothetical protein
MNLLLGFTRLVLLLGVCMAAGCKDENNPLDGDSPSNIVFPLSNVSYTYEVQPLFDQTCALSGCHDDGAHQSLLVLTSWGSLMNGNTFAVTSYKPESSLLVWRIEGSIGPRMPSVQRPLNQNQITGIRAWIGEGAKYP